MSYGFAFRSEPKYKKYVVGLLRYAKARGLGIEFGIFDREGKRRKDFIPILQEYAPFIDINVHMNFYEHRVYNFSKRIPSVMEDIALYKQLNCNYGIIHLTSRSEALKSENHIYQRGMEQLKLVDKIGKQMGFEFYLENVHQSLNFYKKMLENARKFRLTNIHFCFDLGHAKVYSPIDKTTITDWVLWLKTLEKVHFHLHNNRGRKNLKTPHYKLDKHMPFGNETEADDFSEGVEYVSLVRHLENEFPESKKVFEVKPHYGLSNIRTILDLPKEAKLL